MERKCLIYTETQWPIGRERNLVSYWLAAFSLEFFISMQPMKTSGDTVEGWAEQVSTFLWTFPEMPPLLHKHCRQALQYSLCFSQNGLQYPLPVGSFSRHIFYPFLFSFRYNLTLYLLKIENVTENVKTISGSPPIFFPTRHLLACLKLDLTVPLNLSINSKKRWADFLAISCASYIIVIKFNMSVEFVLDANGK
jgi:hypothetical protein